MRFPWKKPGIYIHENKKPNDDDLPPSYSQTVNTTDTTNQSAITDTKKSDPPVPKISMREQILNRVIEEIKTCITKADTSDFDISNEHVVFVIPKYTINGPYKKMTIQGCTTPIICHTILPQIQHHYFQVVDEYNEYYTHDPINFTNRGPYFDLCNFVSERENLNDLMHHSSMKPVYMEYRTIDFELESESVNASKNHESMYLSNMQNKQIIQYVECIILRYNLYFSRIGSSYNEINLQEFVKNKFQDQIAKAYEEDINMITSRINSVPKGKWNNELNLTQKNIKSNFNYFVEQIEKDNLFANYDVTCHKDRLVIRWIS